MNSDLAQNLTAESIENSLSDVFENELGERRNSSDRTEWLWEYYEIRKNEKPYAFPLCKLPAEKNRPASPSASLRLAGNGTETDGTVSPRYTNRGVTTYVSHSPNSDNPQAPALQLGGYDGGAIIGFIGDWNEEQFKTLLANLEQAKNTAIEISQDVETVIGGKPVMVSPSGANDGLHYKYKFTLSDITFLIHHNPAKGRPGVRIRYGACALIGRSLFNVHNAVLDFLHTLGFQEKEEKISRVDAQIIMFRSVNEFIDLIFSERCVKRANKADVRLNNDKPQTYTLGSISAIQLCIYDKKAELAKDNSIKSELFYKHCVGLENFGKPITRIEFRLGRSALKHIGIDTVADLQLKESGLVDWLTSHWFRLLEKEKVRGHENEAALHPLWLEVRAAFRQWFSGIPSENQPVKWERRTVSCDPDKLEKQAVGCLAKAAALRFGIQQTVQKSFHSVVSIIERFRERIYEKTNEAARQLEIIKGVVLGKDLACANAPFNFDDWFYDRE
jgi:hypothetical protein